MIRTGEESMLAANIIESIPERRALSQLAALVRPAAFAVGSLWIAHYALQLGFGLVTGQVLSGAKGVALWCLDALAFFGAYVSTGLSLIGLSARVANKVRYVSVAGALSALVAGGVVGMMAPQFAEAVFSVAGKSILFLFLSALLLSFTGLRRPNFLPRTAALPVFLFGLLTLPLALKLWMWENAVPPYLVMELHFVFSGGAWLFVAVKTRDNT